MAAMLSRFFIPSLSFLSLPLELLLFLDTYCRTSFMPLLQQSDDTRRTSELPSRRNLTTSSHVWGHAKTAATTDEWLWRAYGFLRISWRYNLWIVRIPPPIEWPCTILQAYAQILEQRARFMVTPHDAIWVIPHRSIPIGDELRDNEAKFILVMKNTFQWYILWLFLKSFPKSYVFWDNLNLIIKVCIVLCARPTESQNQDLRPLSDLFWRHKSNRGLRIGKRTSVENRIFWGKHYYLDLLEISTTWYPRLYFRNWVTPGLVFTNRV